jgi:hypothetical protein
MGREVIFNGLTTGSFENVDRFLEIGLAEVVNSRLTGREINYLVNPEGKQVTKFMQEEMSCELHVEKFNEECKLIPGRLFEEIADELLDFIGNILVSLNI